MPSVPSSKGQRQEEQGLTNSRRAAQALFDVGALMFNGSVPYVYTSRKIGPVYVNLRQLSRSPKHWSEVVNELVSLVDAVVGSKNFDAISGGELTDLLFSIPVALRMEKPHVTIRKVAGTHGLGGRIVGVLEPGQRVVHVSDLITFGTSAGDWVGVVRAGGGFISDYFAVFDRRQGGREALASLGVSLHSLLALDEEFLRVAEEDGAIVSADARGISDYLSDPEGWARSLLLDRPEILDTRIAVKEGRLTRSEGVEVLTLGYPPLIPKLGPVVREYLRKKGLKEQVRELGYFPD